MWVWYSRRIQRLGNSQRSGGDFRGGGPPWEGGRAARGPEREDPGGSVGPAALGHSGNGTRCLRSRLLGATGPRKPPPLAAYSVPIPVPVLVLVPIPVPLSAPPVARRPPFTASCDGPALSLDWQRYCPMRSPATGRGRVPSWRPRRL